MPTKVSERWIKDGDAVKSDLEKAGYKVDLEYGDNKVQQQAQQVSNMITKGAKVLIIASIDGGALSDQLDAAAKAGIKVISYDRLLTGNKNVDYYVSFDNYKVGVDQATSLLTGLGVLDSDGKKTDKKGPFNIEVFAGSLDDNNAGFFFNGAMDTLKPYLEDGTLKIQSGQDQLSRPRRSSGTRRPPRPACRTSSRSRTPAAPRLDGALRPRRHLGHHLGPAGRRLRHLGPSAPGRDRSGRRTGERQVDHRRTAVLDDLQGHAQARKQSVTMAEDLLSGKKPEVNDTKSYDNKVKVVPTYLFQPTVVTKDNYKSVLVDSGYYTEADLK